MREGQYLYFWDKKLRKAGLLKVISVSDSSFSFSYLGKTFNCSREYARGKLYSSIEDIPEVRDRDSHRRWVENRESNYGYTPDNDTWVEPGD